MRQVKKPSFYSFIVIVGVIYTVVGFPSVFSPEVKKTGLLFPALMGIFTAAEFMSEIGCWYMKKWGFKLYLMNTLLSQSVKIFIGQWSLLSTLLNIVFLCVTGWQYKKMDNNL